MADALVAPSCRVTTLMTPLMASALRMYEAIGFACDRELDPIRGVPYGRYVLPVRSDAHERVHGIVHGTSATSCTGAWFRIIGKASVA